MSPGFESRAGISGRNDGAGNTSGEPNVWTLTPAGTEVEQALLEQAAPRAAPARTASPRR